VISTKGTAESCTYLTQAPLLLRARLLLCSALVCSLLPAGTMAQFASSSDEYAQLIFEVAPVDTVAPAAPPATSIDRAVAAPGAETLQTLSTIESAIDMAMSSQGLYAPDLRTGYQQLGALQQRMGQHESAITTLEKSVHIARVNDGLYTLDQEADVQQIIENLQALGDTTREADYRAYLYYMQQRAYPEGDPRLVDARMAWADWNLQAYQRSALLNPSSIQLPGGERAEDLVVVRDTRSGEMRFVQRRDVLGAGATAGSLADPTRHSLSADMIIDTRLRIARDIYNDLLDDADNTLTLEQRERLQLQLVSAEYTLKRQMDRLAGEFDVSSAFTGTASGTRVSPMVVRRGFMTSRERFDEEIAALEGAPTPDPLALATAYLRQGDLHIAYESRGQAEGWYAKAWSSLLAAGLDAEAAAVWFQPQPLQPVPDFAIHPHSRELFGIGVDDTLPRRGYIDVSMNLTRDGNVRRADITEASADTPQRVRRILLNYLRNQKMRPRIEQGTLVTAADLRLRFYYSY
jgi:tetratricopeptide (TPR) repeat protein